MKSWFLYWSDCHVPGSILIWLYTIFIYTERSPLHILTKSNTCVSVNKTTSSPGPKVCVTRPAKTGRVLFKHSRQLFTDHLWPWIFHTYSDFNGLYCTIYSLLQTEKWFMWQGVVCTHKPSQWYVTYLYWLMSKLKCAFPQKINGSILLQASL